MRRILPIAALLSLLIPAVSRAQCDEDCPEGDTACTLMQVLSAADEKDAGKIITQAEAALAENELEKMFALLDLIPTDDLTEKQTERLVVLGGAIVNRVHMALANDEYDDALHAANDARRWLATDLARKVLDEKTYDYNTSYVKNTPAHMIIFADNSAKAGKPGQGIHVAQLALRFVDEPAGENLSEQERLIIGRKAGQVILNLAWAAYTRALPDVAYAGLRAARAYRASKLGQKTSDETYDGTVRLLEQSIAAGTDPI